MSSRTFLFEFDLHGQSSCLNPIIIFKKENCIGLSITVRRALDIVIMNFKKYAIRNKFRQLCPTCTTLTSHT
jgi:hypothetical protein